MRMNFLTLLILTFASFRLTRLLVFDKITEFVRRPFFDEWTEVNENEEEEIYLVPKKGGIKNFLGELLSCYWCSGIWSAALLVCLYYLFPGVMTPIALILAIAGAAAIIETIVQYFIEK